MENKFWKEKETWGRNFPKSPVKSVSLSCFDNGT